MCSGIHPLQLYRPISTETCVKRQRGELVESRGPTIIFDPSPLGRTPVSRGCFVTSPRERAQIWRTRWSKRPPGRQDLSPRPKTIRSSLRPRLVAREAHPGRTSLIYTSTLSFTCLNNIFLGPAPEGHNGEALYDPMVPRTFRRQLHLTKRRHWRNVQPFAATRTLKEKKWPKKDCPGEIRDLQKIQPLLATMTTQARRGQSHIYKHHVESDRSKERQSGQDAK